MTSLRHDASQRSLQLKYHPTSIPPPPPPPLTLLPPAMTAAVIGDSVGGRGREPSTKTSAERDRRTAAQMDGETRAAGGARVGVKISTSAEMGEAPRTEIGLRRRRLREHCEARRA
eukprot:CAMPEP_0179947640 /NCGR_PEP_ID=MMETSP0983-20121128/21148_1 /TAXON_ID=483367 /ORGANISM="non described non described, Strain CCMP 2436" /LENGTH=115 /DNA_ID=CAMNT_0021856803 /DNA_START=1080 /DNA_END=1425 /DNA_ORIENTATION=-